MNEDFNEFNKQIVDVQSAKAALLWAFERTQGLSLTVRSLKEQLEQKNLALRDLQRQNLELQRDYDYTELDRTALQQKLKAFQEQIGSLSVQIANKESELTVALHDAQNTILPIQKELEMWKRANNELQAKLSNIQSDEFAKFQEDLKEKKDSHYKDRIHIILEESEGQRKMLQNHISQLNALVKDKENQTEQLYQKVILLETNSEKQKFDLHQEITRVKALPHEKENAFNQLQQTLNLTKSKLDEISNEKTLLEEQLQGMEAIAQQRARQIEELNQKLVQSEIKTAHQNQTVHYHDEKFESLIKDKERQYMKLREEADTAKLKLEDSERRKMLSQEHIRQLEKAQEESGAHVRGLNKKMVSIKIDAEKQRHAQLNEFENLQLLATEKGKKIQNLRDEVNQMRAKMEDSLKIKKAMKETEQSLSSEIIKRNLQIQQLTYTLSGIESNHNTEIDEIQKKNEETKNILQEKTFQSESQLKEKDQTLQTLNEQHLQSKLESEKRFQTQQNETNQIKIACEEKESAVQKSQQELSELKFNFEEEKRQAHSLKNYVDELHKVISERGQEIETLRKKLASLELVSETRERTKRVTDDTRAKKETLTQELKNPIAGPAKILLAESNLKSLQLLTQFLTDEKHIVSQLSDGEKFIQTVQEYNPDVIILDIALNQANSYKLCREVSTGLQTKNIPIILMSSYATTQEIFSDDPQSSVKEFLTKPFSAKDLLNTVRKALRHGAKMKFESSETGSPS